MQDILEELIQIRDKLKPDLVFLPNSHDIHQDHVTVHQEGVRAFKHTRVLGYELPWNNLQASHDLFIKLDRSNLDAKIKAINEYKSQEFRIYKDKDFLEGLAKVRGVQINAEYAESFEVIRWVL